MTALRRVEGPLREAMRRTGCDPACHACGRRLGLDDYGDFVPALTLYGAEFVGGRRVVRAFQCASCIAAGRRVRPEDLLEMTDLALAAVDFIVNSAQAGLYRGTALLTLWRTFGVRPIGDMRMRVTDGPGAWVADGVALTAVWLAGEMRWLSWANIVEDSAEEVRSAYRRATGVAGAPVRP